MAQKRKKRVKKTKRAALISEGGITSRPVDGKLSAKGKIRYEREIRRYIKASGGYRKGLTEKEKMTCEKLMKRVKRKNLEWDTSIQIPGMDKPTVAGMVIT